VDSLVSHSGTDTQALLPSSDRGWDGLVRAHAASSRGCPNFMCFDSRLKLGRKERGGRTEDSECVSCSLLGLARLLINRPSPLSSHPDLLEPHILRSLSNVKVVSVHASCAGCHTIVLDIEGTAWLFGRNQLAALGVPGVDAISENAPRSLRARDLGAPPGTVFVSAASGRSHSVLVGSNGRVWTAGLNSLGQVRSSLTVAPTPLTAGQYKSAGTRPAQKLTHSSS
jgi:Regulator of chromosome condensation (RCC1) repeat